MQGKELELVSEDHGEGRLLTLQHHLKKLNVDKSVLFAKQRYFNQEIASMNHISDPDSIINDVDEDSEAKDSDAWRLVMLNEPILGDCEIKFVDFGDSEAQMAFRHSSAHILGYAIEQVFDDPQLTIGPAVNDGFFYDFFSPDGQVVREDPDYKTIERAVKSIINKNYTFERLFLSKE